MNELWKDELKPVVLNELCRVMSSSSIMAHVLGYSLDEEIR